MEKQLEQQPMEQQPNLMEEQSMDKQPKRSRRQLQQIVASMIRSGKYNTLNSIALKLDVANPVISIAVRNTIVNDIITKEEVSQALPKTFHRLAEKSNGCETSNSLAKLVTAIRSKRFPTLTAIAESLGISQQAVSLALRAALVNGLITADECRQQLPLVRV